ncbi:unnamed protein product [Brachionus calyciflorus]|uniref:Uncharacterized protein n=1 Tax=Brachionus calyciflorus TaxID=104777 RepID=A0A814C327_9BILA|nr:unnamed protein product [Brachionus calyciflorus]
MRPVKFNKYALVKKILANKSFFIQNGRMFNENLNDFFTTTSTATITTLPPIIISSVNNPYGVNLGICLIEECDQNDYVIGFRTKLHPFKGIGLGPSIDDTSLNGVELICPNGSWDAQFRNCSNRQKIIGFSYGIHQNQGINDDTATNVIRLLCKDESIKLDNRKTSIHPNLDTETRSSLESQDSTLLYQTLRIEPPTKCSTPIHTETNEKWFTKLETQSNLHEETAYKELKPLLIQLYGKKATSNLELKRQLTERVQNQYENVHLYASQLKVLAKQSHPELLQYQKDDSIKEQFIRGLREKM